MPIYEYACKLCGHYLETLQKISEGPLVFCPECGEEGLKKKVSAAAFVLKGSGWYETDFKNSGKEKQKEAKASDKESTASKSGDGATSDGKSSDSKSADSKSGSTKSTSDSSSTGTKSGGSKSAAPSN